LRDIDLLSIQEARELAAQAAEAQKKFATFSQGQVDAVVEACAEAATAAGEQLGRLAVEETGYGNVPDKIIKNRLASVEVPRVLRGMKTIGILGEDREKGIVEVATPVGVVVAVIPSTNPTSTAIYKTLIALKAGNAIVHSPHPAAVRCIRETALAMARAALQVGAPDGLILCMEHPTTAGTQELMRHRDTGVILATGGTGLVRAAYSSGKPAYGVGPGNVPAYIERTADVRKAVADIIAGKTFDYGTICSAEQAIVCDDVIREQVLEECRRQRAYFPSREETTRLGELVIVRPAFTPNPKIVGRPATMIAEMAGMRVPADTRVLIAGLDGVGREHPLSAEKLSPILAFYSVANTSAAIELCTRLLHFGGLGHTIAIHSQNETAIREFGQAVPAFRVCVNTSAVHGSIGYTTNLFPAMTLGCGAPGGNITSDNIGPMHLLNVKRIAWESRPVEHRTVPPEQRMAGAVSATGAVLRPGSRQAAGRGVNSAVAPTQPGRETEGVLSSSRSAGAEGTGEAASADRALIARVVERVFAQHGIPPGGPLRGPAAAGAGSHAEEGGSQSDAPTTAGPEGHRFGPEATAAAGPVTVVAFVSESDVRSAITRREKIFIGPRTIVTPLARDLGAAHEVFVETQRSPAS